MDTRTKFAKDVCRIKTRQLCNELGIDPETIIRTEGGVDYDAAEQAERSQDRLFWFARVFKWTAYAGLIATAGLIGFAFGKGIL